MKAQNPNNLMNPEHIASSKASRAGYDLNKWKTPNCDVCGDRIQFYEEGAPHVCRFCKRDKEND